MSFAAAQATYVLHSRPYKETSALVDFFTPLGRLRAVLRGARGGARRPAIRAAGSGVARARRTEDRGPPGKRRHSQPAQWPGAVQRSLSQRAVDPPVAGGRPATGNLRPLRRDPAAAGGGPHRTLLRAFEWRLLEQLGYGFALDVDIDGRPDRAAGVVPALPEAGLEPVAQLQPGLFQGSELLSMADADWSAPAPWRRPSA